MTALPGIAGGTRARQGEGGVAGPVPAVIREA